MLIKFLLKIWPAFLPILFYLLWVFVIDKIIKKVLRKPSTIEGEYRVVGESQTKKEEGIKVSPFSLHNRNFIVVLYFSLIAAILALIFLAIN